MPKSSVAPVTLILSAMPSEIRVFQSQLMQAKRGTVACFPFVTGVLRGRRVITTVTGIM